MTPADLFVQSLKAAMNYPCMGVQRSIDILCEELSSEGLRGRAAVDVIAGPHFDFHDALMVQWGRRSDDLKMATGLSRDQWIGVSNAFFRRTSR